MPPWMESGFHFGRDSKATIRVRAMAYLTRMNCMAYLTRMNCMAYLACMI